VALEDHIIKEQDVSSFKQQPQKSALTILCLLTCLYLTFGYIKWENLFS